MTSNADELFVDEKGEASYWPALIRLSYNVLAFIPESRRMTYVSGSGSSDDWELSSDWSDNGELEDFTIFETGSGILLVMPRTIESLCWIDTQVPGGKGSWIGSIFKVNRR